MAQRAMKQRVTCALFDYWDRLRGTRTAPDRSDLDPGAIRGCLAHTFVLAFDPERGHPFRIAGTLVCAMFGSELTRTAFDRLWIENERSLVRELVHTVTKDSDGVVAGVTGRNSNAETAELEMMLLPLTSTDGGEDRLLGSFAVASAPYWLGTRALRSLSVGELRYTNAAGAAKSGAPLRRQGFVFYPAAPRRISRNFHG